ncbi:MAG: orotate phosphoribosyltransferase [Candidatus Bathyarchaeota archaeon]|nr:orotate phosphoribosyltransferase [Candidatus Bathyarchaeota archaeon]
MKKGEMKAELAQILNRIGALRFGSFKLTSGKMSPYYMDLRVVPSFPDAFKKVCDLYTELIKTEIGTDKIERIAGIPTAGISFGSIAAYNLKKPFLYVRSTPREHGRGRQVEGILNPGDRVVLVDDLVTKGGSVLKAADSVRAEGGVVTDAVVLVDRQENGKQILADADINLHYLLTITELANSLYDVSIISKKQLDTILKQVDQQ